MAEITWGSLLTGVVLFIGLTAGIIGLVTYVLPADTTTTTLNADVNSLQSNVNQLTGNMDSADQNSKPSPTDSLLNPLGAVGNVLGGLKSAKNVVNDSVQMIKSVFGFIPAFVWWTFTAIIVLIGVLLTARAWLRIDV